MIVFLLIEGCFPSWEPRDVDGRAQWADNKERLKALVAWIEAHPAQFAEGNHQFAEGFSHPFDEGFHLRRSGSPATLRDSADRASLVLTFYLDRGIAEHYTAVVYTRHSATAEGLKDNAHNGGNDFVLEPHWYLVND